MGLGVSRYVFCQVPSGLGLDATYRPAAAKMPTPDITLGYPWPARWRQLGSICWHLSWMVRNGDGMESAYVCVRWREMKPAGEKLIAA